MPLLPVLGLWLATSAARSGQPAPAAPDSFAVVGATVITMAGDSVLRDATVIVANGRITAVGPRRRTPVARSIRVIDGRGKFLLPGLVDMHAHLFSDADAPDSVAPAELGAMAAMGITATRLMMGTPEQLTLRREVRAGRVLGPDLWLASPEFAGRAYGEFHGKAVPDPASARAAVREMAAAGFDFIKITLFVGPEAFAALADEARLAGIRLVGHVDPSVGVATALAAGQHVEHLDNYLESVLADSAPMKVSVSDRGVYRKENWRSLDYVDEAKIDRIAGLTARSGTYTTPTLTIFKHAFGLGIPEAELRARPDWNLYPPALRTMWLTAMNRYWADRATDAHRHRWVQVRNRLVKAIADSGGRIMAGSDAPEFLHAYGWTLHRELESLVAAGLSTRQALAAATTTPAAFFGVAGDRGSITPGKRADLLLLAADPLADIRHTTRIAGVAVAGRWLDPAARQVLLDRATRLVGGGDQR
jgi:imidazolonepropionase-like amidohydrolase